jgi:putative peptidoglycan lipid II flippase
MAVGVVLGGALQLCWQLPSLHRLGYRFRPAWDWSDPGLVRILRLMVPAIVGNAATLTNVMVTTNLASGVSDPVRGLDGPVSWLSYAFRFMQLPLGLFGVAMASATLPSISRSVAAGNMEEFRKTLSKSLSVVFLLTLPSSVGLIVLGKSIVGAIYQGGKFQLYDTQQTATALSCYAVGLAGYAALKVLNPAFYALGDSRTPMLVSLISIGVNYGTGVTMIRVANFGHAGLAMATSAVALFSFVALFAILRGRIGGVYGRELGASVIRVAVAAGVMGVVVALTSHGMEAWLGVAQLARLADVVVSIPLGLAAFYAMCRTLGVSDLDMAIRAVAAPIRRRIKGTRKNS